MTTTNNDEPTRRRSSRVVDEFLEQLARGELLPGMRLPPERELAGQLGVGRNSVREAIRELELLGVIESRHGAGTYVTEIDSARLMAPFRSIVAIGSSQATLQEILDFRLAIEPEAAALAARNLDLDTEVLLARALRRFDHAVSDAVDAKTADTSFHFAIARASGNGLIIAVQRALLDMMSRFRSELEPSSYVPEERIPRGHHAIFGAIMARDEAAARDAMRTHLLDVARAMPVSRPASTGDPS